MRSGFFENTEIYATDFATAFSGIFTNGVLMATDVNALLVEAATGMNVTVNPGFCWINGHYAEAAESETLAIELSDGTYNRIDRIVARIDIAEHNISLMVITGTPANSPVAPAIVRNGSYYDLSLATVSVTCGTIEISSAMITDTRLDDTTCGIVQCTAAEIDVEDLFEQYRVQLVAMMTTDHALFTTWFSHLQNELDSNQAAHLLSLIDNNTADIAGLETKTAALTDEGDGTKYLADDGMYKEVVTPQNLYLMCPEGATVCPPYFFSTSNSEAPESSSWPWKKAIIPSSVTSIPYSQSTNNYRILLHSANVEEVISYSPVAFPMYSMYFCRRLKKVTANSSSGTNSFFCYNCTSLTEVNLNAATTIRDRFCGSCTNLKTVNLPNLTTLADPAACFSACTSLENLNLGSRSNVLTINTSSPSSACTLGLTSAVLTRNSILQLANALVTKTNTGTITIQFASVAWAQLSAAEQAIITDKGYTVATV